MSRKASNNVSLFPFLAVLVCAMGALILLLLVTTRRIRSNQVAAQQAEVEVVQPVMEAIPDPEPQIEEPKEEPVPPPPPLVVAKPMRQPNVIPVAGPAVVKTIPSGVTDDKLASNHAERDLHALRGYDSLLSNRLGQWSKADKQLHDQYSAAADKHSKLVDSDKQLNQQAGDIQKQLEDTKITEQRLNAQLASLRRGLAEKESEPVNAISKFRIVPFDGLNGTVRHPIMIECVGDKFRFLPENIELTKTQLENFVAGFNPLLSGAAALNAHWALRDAQTSEVGEPYLLLVVRPSGSLGFYGAKRMLAKLNVPIGYELLGENQELDLPIADPEAVRLCREAVQRTLARSSEMAELRPMARSLLSEAATRRRAGQSQTSGSGAGSRHPSGSTPSDRRTESFQRMVAGMRTENAPRPPGMERYPKFEPRSQPRGRNSKQPLTTEIVGNSPSAGRQGGGQPGASGMAGQQWSNGAPPTPPGSFPGAPAGSAPLPGQTVSRTQPTPREVAQFPGFNGTPQSGTPPRNLAQNGSPGSGATQGGAPQNGQSQNNFTGGKPEQPGAARLSPPRLPAPQPAAPSNMLPSAVARGMQSGATPPGTPGIPGAIGQPGNGPPRSGAQGRPTYVTDGSTKPVDQRAANQARQSGASGSGSGSPNGQVPRPGFAKLEGNQKSPVTRFRRAVDLFVDLNGVVVANNKRISVGQGEVSGPWLGAILTQIEAEVRGWGEAPMGTAWAPEVRFRISPGANQTHTRLRNSLKRLGMRTTDEFATAPKTQNAGDVFRSGQQTQRTGAGGSR